MTEQPGGAPPAETLPAEPSAAASSAAASSAAASSAAASSAAEARAAEAPAAEALAAAAAPDGILVLDAHGRVRYANPAAGRLLDTSPAALLGRPLEQVADLRDPAGRPWWPCTQQLRRLPRVRGTPTRELHLTLGDTTRLIDLTATFVRDGRAVTHTVCTLRDATARRRAQTAAADLTAVLAHELRSPLTSVRGFSATLLRRWDRFDDAQKRHMLATVTADADRLARLVGQLLDVARIDSGRLELHPQPLNLAELAAAAAAAAAAGHPERTVESRFPPARLDVYADAGKVQQALGNLVEYLVQHTDGTVTLTGAATAAAVEVAVAGGELTGPTGQPATPAQLRLLFTRPDRPPHTRRAATGDLGLYIARGLIAAHGGHVWAHTTPQRRTELRFRLPR